MRALAAAVLLIPLVVTPTLAQTPDDPCPSQVVRWNVADHFVEGVLLETPISGQPLKVQQRGFAGTKALDRNTPDLACRMQRSQKGNRALIGLVSGALIGGVIGYSGGDDHGWFALSAGQKATFGAITLGAIGALVGAISGPGSTWAPLGPASGARRVSLLVDGSRLGLRVRF